MVIPMVSSIDVPVIANSVRIQKEMIEPLTAIERLSAVDIPTVRPRNKGALPMGSVMTNNVTKALSKTSMLGTVAT